MIVTKRRIFGGALTLACLAGLCAGLKAYANQNQTFLVRFHNETGTDIILSVDSPENGVYFSTRLDKGERSDRLNMRGGNRSMVAWDDTTLKVVTIAPLTIDENMRVKVEQTPTTTATYRIIERTDAP